MVIVVYLTKNSKSHMHNSTCKIAAGEFQRQDAHSKETRTAHFLAFL
jgi:hypothetical protein